ncbi:MAG TPA: aminotransferase class V-fold PLP-dependent enzyme [Polyangiaceae bacterium]|nr:aminotransferase class V-fold PLP-dependent enzyme [Polyangiaceae bacterium]
MTVQQSVRSIERVHMPRVLGQETELRTSRGKLVRIVQLNNAATAPPFESTVQRLHQFLETYGALHRGAGPRARLTCEYVEEAKARIRAFLGCPEGHHVLFTENTSAAVNLLARLLNLGEKDVVLTSELEHTSKYLPWRFNTRAEVVEVAARDDGSLMMGDFEEKVLRYRDRLRVIAISGASNLTGYVTDLPALAKLAASSGALLFVDAAQLAPHRPIDMARDGIGALAFSAHKLYAPFGLGVLVVPRKILERAPVSPGGGSIDMISRERVMWSPADERHQAGTWNASGIVALGTSCATIQEAGWSGILEHERMLVDYAARRLSRVPGLTLHVAAEKFGEQGRIGTFPFTLDGYQPFHLAAILEHEHGIEVRAGTICNHRLVRRWFNVDEAGQAAVESAIEQGNRLASYGIARASLGIHNTTEDVDRLVDALSAIRMHGPALKYRPVPEHESYELVE